MRAPDPIAFSLFGLDIRWYGVLIATGVILALIITYKRAPLHQIDSESVLDVAIWMLPAGIVGARLYYVLFNYKISELSILEIINTRAGGLAIHGGLIFGAIAAYLVCKYKKVDFIEMLDLFLPSVALAQAIGRWGNFFNEEAYGIHTNLPWAIIIDGDTVHPTFLYESIWCLIIFFVLLKIDNNRLFKGQIACLYGIMYSFERFFVEWLRTDSLMIGPLRQAQVISIAIFIFSLVMYFSLNRNNTKIEK